MGDVIITRGNGGLGRRSPQTDMVSGLVISGYPESGLAQLDTVYKLQRLSDATALGFTSDGSNTHAYEHIKEFFRMNPNGTLWIILGLVTVNYVDLIENYAPKLLQKANGEINQLGISYNPQTPVSTPDHLLDAIPVAQALADSEFQNNKPLLVVLEGRGFDIEEPFDLRAMNVPSVCVVIGQGNEYADYDPNYAAVGTVLGAISKAPVNVNIGWVQNFNCYGSNLTGWRIGNTATVSQTLQDDLNTLGFIFFRNHTGIAGIYLNDSHTGAEITSDYAYIENVRTSNKVVRIIRKTMLPNVNAPIQVNPTTGQLPLPVVSAWEAQVNKVVKEEMLNNSELSGFTYFIDPEQNILSTSELNSEFELIPTGTARTIRATVSFSNPFNS